MFLPDALRIGRIRTPDMHIGAVPVHLAHMLLVGQQVIRIAGQRIGCRETDHAAHLELRIVLVGILYGLCAGDEHVVQRLKSLGRLVRDFRQLAVKSLDRAAIQDRTHRHRAGVDFIESEPVFYQILITLKYSLAVVHKQLDQLAALPAVVFLNERIGKLIVRDCNQRLNAVLLALLEHVLVELKTLLVRLCLHAGREDTGPVDRCTEGLEAHLGKKRDVFFVMMIEINCFVGGIQSSRLNGGRHSLRVCVASVCAHIGDRRTLAVDIPGTFTLVCGYRAAPQKVIS